MNAGGSYLNPVYAHSCPDPFVLKHQGQYWAYCTGTWGDGQVFGILRSPDLVRWESTGAAMPRLPGDATCYWAPEVAYINGRFYLYYSYGNEERMHLRVAVAERPDGPFEDSGEQLTQEDFAIDPHPFQDDDGAWYMFYATDYLTYERIGTGVAVDRMVSPLKLAGEPRPVARALYDWQIYDRQRAAKGGVCWHTVEGSFVLKHKGRYYHMFSGGNWQNISYGVAYATTRDLESPDEWEQHCDGVQHLPVLRTLPDIGVIGPGHNSVVRGPDNRQLFCIYHRWQGQAGGEGGERVMAIDRLEWIGDRLEVLGPTTMPQPAPLRPSMTYLALRRRLEVTDQRPDGEDFPPGWLIKGGGWRVDENGQAVQALPHPGKLSEARLALPTSAFLAEVGFRSLDPVLRSPGAFGLRLDKEDEELLEIVFVLPSREGHRSTGLLTTGARDQQKEWSLPVAEDFAPQVDHTLRMEVSGQLAQVRLDGTLVWAGRLSGEPDSLALVTRGMAAAFGPLEISLGWEDSFMMTALSGNRQKMIAGADLLEALKWQIVAGNWVVEEHRLRQLDAQAPYAQVYKGPALEDYELVVNARLRTHSAAESTVGIFPAAIPGDRQPDGPLFYLVEQNSRWELAYRWGERHEVFSLPKDFDPFIDQQFRFRKAEGRVHVWIAHSSGLQALGEGPAPSGPCQVGLSTHLASADFDLVRVTAI